MRICFDIDGVLCSNEPPGQYHKAVPDHAVLYEIKRLAVEGHTIILHTARGTLSGIDYELLTREQLNKWGVVYHELHFHKPAADVYIDDKGMNVKDWKPRKGFHELLARS